MRKFVLALVLLAAAAWAGDHVIGGGGGGHLVQDEGGAITQRDTINCVGGGITCSDNGGKTEINVPVGGGATITVQEGDANVDAATSTIDFGTGLDATSAPAGEANVSVDMTELAHAASHQNGGADEVAQAAAAANVIPKAGAGGFLADAFVDGSLEANELVLVGDVDGTANANTLDIVNTEEALEAALDFAGGEITGTMDTAVIADSLAVTSWVLTTSSANASPAANDNDTSLATTAFVQSEIDDGDFLTDNCILENDATPIPDTCVGDGSDGGGAGGNVIFDIGDDAGNDSAAIVEIATSGDTNTIFTEPSADKILINLANDWPKADTADDLTCTNCIGPTEITDLTLGTDTAGNYVRAVLDGTGIDGTAGGDGSSDYTPTFDATELTNLTWSAGGGATIVWTYNVSGTDDVITFGDGTVGFNGTLTATSIDSADNTTTGNLLTVFDNSTNLTPDPTCANKGTVGRWTMLDTDEGASIQADLCYDTALQWRTPATSVTTTQFLAATATAGVGAYRAIALGDVDDDVVGFDDADSNWTATVLGPALEELDDVINGGVPNAATGKVDWSQVVNVPAGIADGVDADSGGSTAIDALNDVGAGDDAVGMVEQGQTWTWNTAASSAAFDGMTFAMVNDATTDANTQEIVSITNANSGNDAAGATESGLHIENADTNDALTVGLRIDSAAGTIPTAIDVSDAEIGTALAIGLNEVTAGGNTITAAELATVSAGITLGTETNGNYIDSVGSTAASGIAVTGAPGEPWQPSVDFDYSYTLAGNPAISVSRVVLNDDCPGGGFMSEGSAANTNEQLYCFPNVDGVDTTSLIAVDDATSVTNIDGAGLVISAGALAVGTGTGLSAAADQLDIDYSQTLAGNPIIVAGGAIFSDDCPGGGFLSEGSVGANTNEQLYCFPAVDGVDTTQEIAMVAGALGAATATSPAADDSDTSVATTAYVQGELNAAGGRSLSCAAGSCDADAELFTRTLSATIKSPTDADDFLWTRANQAWTITAINCIVDPAGAGESVVITMNEYDATGDNPAGLDGATTITCDNDGQADDGALSNASIASGGWVGVVMGAPTGTVSFLTITLSYTVND